MCATGLAPWVVLSFISTVSLVRIRRFHNVEREQVNKNGWSGRIDRHYTRLCLTNDEIMSLADSRMRLVFTGSCYIVQLESSPEV